MHPELLKIKFALHDHCKHVIHSRILELKSSMESILESSRNETKSSAGDKHETSRALMMQEYDNLQVNLNNLQQQKDWLEKNDPAVIKHKVAEGALIITNNGNFYNGIALPKLELDGIEYHFISYSSPVSTALKFKESGDIIVFNGKNIRIENII